MVHRLMENGGRLSAEEVRKALLQAMPGATVEGLLAPEQAAADQFETADPVADPSRINWFEEWDTDAGDYRPRHVRVIDRPCESVDTTFYARTLSRHRDLVTRIRYAFELLKPEGLKRLRRWVDGDSLDYRQLIDVVLDRKAGLLPSDRIYTKRIKRTRDVSMLMLVDLSRSTSNIVTTDGSTVLDMEKEAIVLFSQALEVLGDRFAIAGFSGNGRLDVDYITVKGFDDPLTETVRNRISGLTSRRNTRMGAAIRRSRLDLDNAGSPVRLLILLSDGFPNDLGYKKQYAVEDTRKAIAEARATGITTHGITVNLPGHPRLDALYGNTGHTVISDVKELPDRLMRVYGSLTRF
jgi:nitric oxide reductase activation protein